MADILLVDDEEQLRELLTFVLENAGHIVRKAADGNEALESYRNDPADVVVTDIVMPNKEGTETILELRRNYPGIKIIAMSGGGRNNPQDYLKLAKTFGANMTLAKPFTNQEFLDAVRTVLEM
jgi:CheY-like chemotaxis protein